MEGGDSQKSTRKKRGARAYYLESTVHIRIYIYIYLLLNLRKVCPYAPNYRFVLILSHKI